MLLFFKGDTKIRQFLTFSAIHRLNNLVRAAIASLLLLAGCGGPDTAEIVRPEEPGYTGLARCALCHTNLYGEWKRSLHSRAMGVPADSTVVGDFSDVRHTYGGVTSRMYKNDAGYYMETLGPDGEIQPYRVDYTIGVRQHQAYLTTFPDGRLQVLPLYHDGESGNWVDAQEGGVVERADPVKPGDFYFWANRGRSWNYHCYDCHASRVEKHYDPADDTYETTVGSLTIDCEACHGPGELHDDTRETPGADLNMVDLERLSNEEQIEVCAQCHAAKEVLATGYAAGESFYDHYMLYLPDDETFHPDGQPKVYLYPAGLHLMSTCFTEGDLVCTSCHDPHGSDHEVDLVASKRSTALCASCHEEIAADPTSHSHHKLESEGNTCVGCHMPYHDVTGEKMTDHRIASPSPQNSVRFGVPNSCNTSGCHAEKTPAWAAEYVDNWYPGFQDLEEKRVEPFALGKQGDRSAIPGLVNRLSDPQVAPVWRAVAATLLGKLDAVSAVDDLIQALADPFPMQRLRAAIALGRIGDSRAIPPLVSVLSDSTRAVRIYTAFALSDLGFLPPAGQTQDAYQLALAEYEQMAQGLQSDDPGMLDGLGELKERNGDYTAARSLFDAVQKLDPNHPSTKEDLDRINRLSGILAAGEPALKEAVEDAPEDFGARGRLGSFYLKHSQIEPAGLQLRGASAQLQSVAILLGEARVSAKEGGVDRAIHSVLAALDIQKDHRQAARDLVKLVLSSGTELGAPDHPAEDSPWGWWRLGVAHAREGEFSKARSAFLSCLAREAELIKVEAGDVNALIGVTRAGARHLDQSAGRIFSLGTEAFSAGEMAEAASHFKVCVDLSPAEAQGYLLLAIALDEQQQTRDAYTLASEATFLAPDLSDGYSVLGSIAQSGGRVGSAIGSYRVALALNPADQDATLNLSHLYMVQGKPNLARSVLQRSLEVNPNNPLVKDMLRDIDSRL
jgi:predicted CXXCH cytochrome family protein